MRRYDYDLFVFGAGSGGVRASRMSAAFGARVAVAEAHRVGGTCVIRGCVPKKLMVYASRFGEDFEDARGFGWEVPDPEFSWVHLARARDLEIARLEGVYEGLLTHAGVTLMRGRATLIDAHTVDVDGSRYTTKYVLIATGAWPILPDIRGAELGKTSNEAFELNNLPRRVLMVGGGYIAVEFAGIFRGLGADITLSYRGAELLRGFDNGVRRHLREEMETRGIKVLLGHEVAAIERNGVELRVHGSDGGTLDCEMVMFATGRMPNSMNLGLERAGIELDSKGAVVVDAYSRTTVENVYAVGDVTNRIQLTPVAVREGAAVANTLFNGRPTRVDHRNVPTAIFSQPPIGTVGDTEDQAIATYGSVEVYQTSFRSLKNALSGRAEKTFMKLLVEPASQKVIGAHMVGTDAPEIIQGIGIAVVAGLTKQQFDDTVGIHPSSAEEFVTMREKVVRERAMIATSLPRCI